MKMVPLILTLCLLPLFLCCSKGEDVDVVPPQPKPTPDTTSIKKPDTDSASVDHPSVTIHTWDNDGNDYGGTAE